MNFELDEGQRLIADSVSRYLGAEYGFDRRRAHLATEHGFTDALWRDFAELGWLGVGLPEAYGGLGAGAVEIAILAEQFGRHLVVSPFLSSAVLCARAVQAGRDEAQRAALLPALAAGELVIAPAFAEPRARFDPYFVETRAEPRGGGFAIDGQKCVVPFAVAAGRLLVTARVAGAPGDRDGIGLFLVDAAARGIDYQHFRTQDGGRASEVRLRSVPVDLVLAEPGADALDAALDAATAAACAEACGAMWAVYERTLEYLKTREQFGSTLGSFQALQHRIVDVWIHCQLARSMACDAAVAVRDADPRSRGRTVSGAMHKIARSARSVGQEGVQLHGGIGMTDDLPIGHYLKRLTAIGSSFGDAAWHLGRYRALSR